MKCVLPSLKSIVKCLLPLWKASYHLLPLWKASYLLLPLWNLWCVAQGKWEPPLVPQIAAHCLPLDSHTTSPHASLCTSIQQSTADLYLSAWVIGLCIGSLLSHPKACPASVQVFKYRKVQARVNLRCWVHLSGVTTVKDALKIFMLWSNWPLGCDAAWIPENQNALIRKWIYILQCLVNNSYGV